LNPWHNQGGVLQGMATTQQVIQGDALAVLRTLLDQSVNTCVTSPPYYGLRDYGVDGQIGLESTPAEYVTKMVNVFREVRRVLRDDGTCWVNLGDSYNTGTTAQSKPAPKTNVGYWQKADAIGRPRLNWLGLKTKDLCGIPWRIAFALQADGWYLRQDIIWHKPNPMPESVRDRCTKAHEYIFLLAKSERYYFDSEAMKEPLATKAHAPGNKKLDDSRNDHDQMAKVWGADGKRNKRSVWTVNPRPYKGAHFATFPPDLIRPCVLAGCPNGGTVLDPFNGSGTTGIVARDAGRNYIGIELNPAYIELTHQRWAEPPHKPKSRTKPAVPTTRNLFESVA